MISFEKKWRAPHKSALVWRHWDHDEYLLFDRRSGDTHLLNQLAAQVLVVLQESDCDLTSLCLTIADRMEVVPDATLKEQLQHLLEHFDEIGLIEPSREDL